MKNRLLLVSPWGWGKDQTSAWLGGWRLKAWIEENLRDWEVIVYDTAVRDPRAEHVANVKLIGCGSLWLTREADLKYAKMLKAKYGVPVVFGGIGPHFMPDEYLGVANMVVRGEGEKPIVDVLTGNAMEQVVGPNWLDEEEWRHATMRLYDHLDVMPWDRIWKFNWEHKRRTPAIRLVTVSVCKRRCMFCCSHNFIDKFKMLTTEQLKEVIEHASALGPDVIIMQGDDELFGRAKKRWLELWEQGWKSPRPLIIQTHVECLKQEGVVEKLREIGVVEVDLGVESFSNAILREYRKSTREKDITQVFERCLKVGMKVYANIILRGPRSRDEDVEYTKKRIEEWKKRGIKFGVNPEVYTIPGSDFWDEEFRSNVGKS